MKHVIRIRMDLFLSLISLALVSMLVPSYAYGQVAALQPMPTPIQTQSQMVYTQCIDFNTDKVCEYIVLANGTTIANPLVQQLQAPAPMSQLVERQKTIIKEIQRDNDDEDDDNDDGIPDCDGSFQDCIHDGFFCEAGSTRHECELEDGEEIGNDNDDDNDNDRNDVIEVDDVEDFEGGDSQETATGDREYDPEGDSTCGNDETGDEWAC